MSALQPSLRHRLSRHALVLVCSGYTLISHAQSLCSSADTPLAQGLFERFISADCVPCWRDPATAVPPVNALAVDWIAPGKLGDAAPLSVAAIQEATDRLHELGRQNLEGASHNYSAFKNWPGTQLTVAFGRTVGRYVGVSVELAVAQNTTSLPDLDLWLLLLEQLPSGTEGSAVPRHLVRNVLQLRWGEDALKADAKGVHLSELRPMSLPEGTQSQRLQVAAWVQDAQGNLIQAAHTACAPRDAL
jgi:hypothetical protein